MATPRAWAIGLRQDKPARKISKESAVSAKKVEPKPISRVAASAPARTTTAAARMKADKLSHPDRIIDPSTGYTKLELARYYGLVAPLLLEHLKGRPVSFLRAPNVIQAPLFFRNT
jgi:bifunctional non-homologous end joining protein LigD